MKKSIKVKTIIIIALIVAIILAGIFAYSKYVKSISGQATGLVANWSFKVN